MSILKYKIYKGSDVITSINEYLLILKGGNEIYRVYSANEQVAINTFKNACENYAMTKNKEWQNHWINLYNTVSRGEYTLLKCDDFIGVRKVI